MFAADFLLGHFILFLLFLFCLIPYIDRVHSLMLFWLRPSKQIRPQILSIKKSKQRRRIVILYSALFVLISLVLIAAIVVPCILHPQVSLAKFSAIDVWIRNLYNICIPILHFFPFTFDKTSLPLLNKWLYNKWQIMMDFLLFSHTVFMQKHFTSTVKKFCFHYCKKIYLGKWPNLKMV